MSATKRPGTAKELRAYRSRGYDCVCGNLRMASRAISSIYDAHLGPFGLTINQLTVLWCVIAREPVGMGDIGKMVVMDKTTVSRNVALLVEMRLVRLKPGADARHKLVSSTPKGRRTFAAAMPAWEAAQAKMSALMGEDRFAGLVQQTRAIAETIGATR